jgi:hypothetical protein
LRRNKAVLYYSCVRKVVSLITPFLPHVPN